MTKSALPIRGHDEIKTLRLQVAALETTLVERSAEAARLRDSERRYRCLVEHSLGLICTHDANGRLLSINPAAARALDRHPHELIGRPISAVLAPRVRPAFSDYLTRVFDHGMDQGLMVVVTRSGEELIWAYRNVRIDEPAGASYVVGHAQDITALERARETIKRARAEMRDRIAHRTAALVAANERLMSELGEHALIEESFRRSRTRLELLNAIAVGGTATTSRRGVIRRAVKTMSGYFQDCRVFFARCVDNGAVTIRYEAIDTVDQAWESSPQVVWPDVYLNLLRRGEAILVPDTRQDERIRGYECGYRSVLAVPVRRDEEVNGLLAVTASDPRNWPEYDLETMREIAGYLSLALKENVRE